MLPMDEAASHLGICLGDAGWRVRKAGRPALAEARPVRNPRNCHSRAPFGGGDWHSLGMASAPVRGAHAIGLACRADGPTSRFFSRMPRF